MRLFVLTLILAFYLPLTASSKNTSRAEKVASCVEGKRDKSLLRFAYPYEGGTVQFNTIDVQYDIITGSLGWHATWIVLLDFDTNPATASETFIESEVGGVFARRSVPWLISNALEKCGFTWNGEPDLDVLLSLIERSRTNENGNKEP